jgi:hypothetical protein
MHLDKFAAAIGRTVTALRGHVVHFGAINIPDSLDFARTHH